MFTNFSDCNGVYGQQQPMPNLLLKRSQAAKPNYKLNFASSAQAQSVYPSCENAILHKELSEHRYLDAYMAFSHEGYTAQSLLEL